MVMLKHVVCIVITFELYATTENQCRCSKHIKTVLSIMYPNAFLVQTLNDISRQRVDRQTYSSQFFCTQLVPWFCMSVCTYLTCQQVLVLHRGLCTSNLPSREVLDWLSEGAPISKSNNHYTYVPMELQHRMMHVRNWEAAGTVWPHTYLVVNLHCGIDIQRSSSSVAMVIVWSLLYVRISLDWHASVHKIKSEHQQRTDAAWLYS